MQNNIKQINIKSRPCYFFNDMINKVINIKNFDPRLLEINKLSFKGVFSVNIYYIKYVTTTKISFVLFLIMYMDTLTKTLELNI